MDKRSKERVESMKSFIVSGKSLQEVGDIFGISRERVRQILAKNGFTYRSGKDKNEEANYWGYDDVQEYIDAIESMPKCKIRFREQKNSALHRGIEWKLSFKEWVDIWRDHWDKRGRGHGKVMCRNKDQGAYEVGNVFIASGVFNATAYQMRRWHGVDIENDPYYAGMR